MNVTPLPVPSFITSDQQPEEAGMPKSFMLYGDTGTEKTLSIGKLFAAGWFKKILILNLDNSLEVLYSDPDFKVATADGRVTIKTFDTNSPTARQEIEGAILEISGMYRNPQGYIVPNPNIPDFGFDLVVIDTFNLVHEVALKDFQATTYNAAGTKLDGLAAYGRVAVWDDEMVRLIHTTHRFTGAFLMHAKTDEEKTGATKVKPKLSGSFKDSIGSIPSIVAYLDYQKEPGSDEVVLTATVGRSDTYVSKNRFNLPPKIYNFSMPDIYATIAQKVGAPIPAVTTLAAVAA